MARKKSQFTKPSLTGGSKQDMDSMVKHDAPKPSGKAVGRPIRIAAIGDALMTLPLVTRRNPGDRITSFSNAAPLNWLRIMAPEIDLPEERVLGRAGTSTVDVAEQLADVVAMGADIDAVLVCVGLQDCFAMVKGTAPEAKSTIESLETIVSTLIAHAITPFIILPPPCPQFTNGLFADRYLAIAATLRRMARQTPGMVLIDPTDELKEPEAFGVEPVAGYSRGDDHGQLTIKGSVTLARCIKKAIHGQYGSETKGAFRTSVPLEEAVNHNPRLLVGTGGKLSGPSSKGSAPFGFELDTTYAAGIRAFALTNAEAGPRAACQISFFGRYTSNWCFVRLTSSLDAEVLASFNPGDTIEAVCDYELVNPLQNVTLISCNLSAVWEKDYMAFSSTDQYGDLATVEPHAGVLRTPRVKLDNPLTKLGVAVTVFFKPGEKIDASATLHLSSVVVRKVK